MRKYLEDGTIIEGSPEEFERFEHYEQKKRSVQKLRRMIY